MVYFLFNCNLKIVSFFLQDPVELSPKTYHLFSYRFCRHILQINSEFHVI